MATNTQNKLHVGSLNTVSFADACALWNQGFKGYVVDMTMSVDSFIARLHLESLLVEKSLIAFSGERAVGFLLNGIRDNAGKRVAWNGGTGVAPEYRGKGVGNALVDAALALYEKEGVDYATLEAINTNDAAIRLYSKCGYEIVGELTFLERQGVLEGNLPAIQHEERYVSQIVPPPLVGELEFYQAHVAWQAQWQSSSVNQGSGLIVCDEERVPVGYSLFRKQFGQTGKLTAISLHQCMAHPERDDAESIFGHMIRQVFAPLDISCNRFTHNFLKSNELVIQMLEQAGFKASIEQLLMVKTLRG